MALPDEKVRYKPVIIVELFFKCGQVTLSTRELVFSF